MAEENQEEKLLLPHHEAQSLCTTRLPYRQGRKLTAVKVYSVNSESNHLLVFGVPSLSLRQETKALFSKFGKLLSFSITTKYPTEPFTENYHASFEDIQSSRIAKKMLDGKNFYGGSLHVCYAPELESLDETRNKLFKRHKDVTNRIRNLIKNEQLNKNNDTAAVANTSTVQDKNVLLKSKINMGEFNIIEYENSCIDQYKNNIHKRKIPPSNKVIEKQFKPCYVENDNSQTECIVQIQEGNSVVRNSNSAKLLGEKSKNSSDSVIDVIDFTSTEKEIVSNINEALNYNKFGNETIRKIPQKPVNRIKFNVVHKKL